MESDISKVLFDERTILSRIAELAQSIERDFAGKELTVVAILNGSFVFMADLLRRVRMPLQIDSWSVSSYHGTKSKGRIEFRQQRIADVRGRHVLVLDDILDSGTTLHAIRSRLIEESGAADIKTCVLLNKQAPRLVNLEADYVGFNIPNEFVVGYGLDYNERYRNLPFIGVLSDEAIKRHAI